jgi:hypothetical protein
MVGGEVFGEGRGDRCDPGGEAYLADGGGLRPVAGVSGARAGGAASDKGAPWPRAAAGGGARGTSLTL